MGDSQEVMKEENKEGKDRTKMEEQILVRKDKVRSTRSSIVAKIYKRGHMKKENKI